MKNVKNLFKARITPIAGIIALVAIVGVSMAGCAEEEDFGDEFNGIWVNKTDAADIITISSPNWSRTKSVYTAGTLDFYSSPSYAPNIRAGGDKVGQAQVEGNVLFWYDTQNNSGTFASGNFVRK